MTHPKLRTPLALAAATAAVAVTAATAIAGNAKHIDSKVTLAGSDPFHGKVRSPKHACEAHRLVKVFNVEAAPNGLVGKTRSDRHGEWSLPESANGQYYAKVRRHRKRLAHGPIVCRADLSPVRDFSGSGQTGTAPVVAPAPTPSRTGSN
jgi:hypothetical protein